MTSKSYLVWWHTRNWCKENPNKIAAVVCPEGRFEITFKPNPIVVVEFDESRELPFEWLKERFLKNG